MKLKEFSFCLFVLIALSSCSGKKVDESDPGSLYKDAMEDVDDSRYLTALEKLKVIKNKFPYSNYSILAKLAIADIHFKEESYVEAAGAYETFRDLHPKNEKADYVIFRIGESYYQQLPGTNDRDFSPATRAIESYKELIQLYPKSTYVPEAREHLLDSMDRMAAKEKYIADYYFKQEMYDSSESRYEKLIDQYAGSKYEEDAYFGWGRSLLRQDKNDQADHTFRVYLSKFPNGKYTGVIGDHLKDAK